MRNLFPSHKTTSRAIENTEIALFMIFPFKIQLGRRVNINQPIVTADLFEIIEARLDYEPLHAAKTVFTDDHTLKFKVPLFGGSGRAMSMQAIHWGIFKISIEDETVDPHYTYYFGSALIFFVAITIFLFLMLRKSESEPPTSVLAFGAIFFFLSLVTTILNQRAAL